MGTREAFAQPTGLIEVLALPIDIDLSWRRYGNTRCILVGKLWKRVVNQAGIKASDECACGYNGGNQIGNVAVIVPQLFTTQHLASWRVLDE